MTTAPPEPKTRTDSLYFRGSSKLREDAEQFGLARNLTLSSALALLVERGLEAVANEESVRALEQNCQRLEQEVAVLRERDQKWSTVFSSLQGQLQTLRVGKCLNCHQSVTAFDHLLTHRCPWPACAKPLTHVEVERSEEFPPALAGLVGALGGLLFGIAASQSGGAAGKLTGSQESHPLTGGNHDGG